MIPAGAKTPVARCGRRRWRMDGRPSLPEQQAPGKSAAGAALSLGCAACRLQHAGPERGLVVGRVGVRRRRTGRTLDHDHASGRRSEEHTSELQSLMRISSAVFCLKKKKHKLKSTINPILEN